MNKIIELADQHVREAESHLRKIDELMARARRGVATSPASQEAAASLERIQRDRDRLGRELDDMRKLPRNGDADAATRGEGLKGAIVAVGQELDKVIVTLFDMHS